MSLRSFRAIRNKVIAKPKAWTEADIVATARQLLEEHAQRREEATALANLVCGNCEGSGSMPSTLMPGESLTCFACAGTGKPNDKIQAIPELLPEDHERMWKIEQLLVNYPAYRVAVLGVIKEFFPTMYAERAEAQPS